jgi:SAM-dependent methyltransferase
MTGSTADADAFNAFEAAGWETTAAGYDDFFGQITPRVLEPLLDAAHVGSGVRVLDVATGPGYVAARAEQRGASVVGVDIAEAMVSLARRRHPQLEFRRGNAEALPFVDGSFDAVVGNFVMHHLGQPEQAVSEFARVLLPGGRLALTVWDVPSRARFVGVFVDAVGEIGARPPRDLPAGPDFFRFSEEEELIRVLGDHELDGIKVNTIAFTHPVSSPDELWHGLLAGTVRTSAIVRGQPDDVQRRIRAAFDRHLEPYRVGTRLELPVSVRLAAARRAPTSRARGRRE